MRKFSTPELFMFNFMTERSYTVKFCKGKFYYFDGERESSADGRFIFRMFRYSKVIGTV